MSTNYNPSHARVVKATIKSFSDREQDITPVVVGFEITQSLDQPGYHGHLVIIEQVALLENFTLRGEEKLDLEIVGQDFNTKIEIQAQIYKINDVAIIKPDDRLTYKLHFVSRINYDANEKKVILPFHDVTASYTAEQIFRKYYSELVPASSFEILPYGVKAYSMNNDKKRKFYIQPTEGNLKGVIPNFAPAEAMYFMAQRSYSTDSPSCSFRFFENYDGIYFVTDEFLIKRAIDEAAKAKNEKRRPKYLVELIYLPIVDHGSLAAEVHTRLIEGLKNEFRVDTSADLLSGGYANKGIEIDLIRRNVTERNFFYTDYLNYINMSGEIVNTSTDVHTPDFIDKTFTENNAKRFLIYRDFSQVGDNPSTIRADQFYSEITSNKMFYKHHMNTTVVRVDLKGRIDIQAGKVVNIDIPEINLSSDRSSNKQLSGNYLVDTVIHQLDENTLKTRLRLIKYNWST
jgi:hypothetical protein